MSYGLIYIGEFDLIERPASTEQNSYKINILKKDYTGPVRRLLLGDDPFVQQWQLDDPRGPIKGSNASVNIVNTGLISIDDFFSTEDDTFLGQFYWGDKNLFVGYLVQDDCREILIDTPHDFKLSFTDNLGLLKDVPLSDAASRFGPSTEYDRDVAYSGPHIMVIGFGDMDIVVGDSIVISDSGVPRDGVYTVEGFTSGSTGSGTVYYVTIKETLSSWPGSGSAAHITIVRPIDLTRRMVLKEYLRLCLLSTNLQLRTVLYNNLHNAGTATSFNSLECALQGDLYLTDDSSLSCYDVLTSILETFECVLMQCEGMWMIIRWDELRYYNNQPQSLIYDSIFHRQLELKAINVASYGDLTDIETGFEGSIQRPYKFVKKTFDFGKPKLLLRNSDFRSLGPLLSEYSIDETQVYQWGGNNSSYAVGAYQVKEYEWKYTNDSAFGPVFSQRVIRIVFAPGGIELFRIGLLKGDSTSQDTAIMEPFEFNAADRLNVTFNAKTKLSQPGPGNYTALSVRISNGVDTFTLRQDGTWISGPAVGTITIASPSDNSNQWANVDVNSSGAPISGLVTTTLFQEFSLFEEVQFNNMKFSVSYAVNDSVLIKGQVHTDLQQGNINNSLSSDIKIDDSPRNLVEGTLFLNTFTSLIQDRTLYWNRGGIAETKRLREITTFEQLFWRRVPRKKLEGNLLGIIKSSTHNATKSVIFLQQFGQQVMLITNDSSIWYPVGAIFTITGSPSNDGTFTVVSSSQNTIVTTVVVVETVVPEGPIAGVSISSTYKFHITAATVINYLQDADKYFVVGSLAINYKKNQARVTLYEQWRAGEQDSDLIHDYEFKYLYTTQ